jgi:hypothetical protein
MLSSKMFAGLLAGGLGILLDVVLVTAFLGLPTAALVLEIALLLGVGVFAGILAIHWLDPNDDGRQRSVGALAGLVAACIVEAGDILLRVITNTLHKPNLTDQLYSAVAASLPGTGAASKLMLVLINVTLYLLYLIVTAGIAGATADVFGNRKSQQAQAAQEQSRKAAYESWVREEAREPIDPALVVYQRRDYSPFADDPAPPLPYWQRRRLEREGQLDEQEESFSSTEQSGPLYRVGFLDGWQGPKQPKPRAQSVPPRKGPPSRSTGQRPTGHRGDRRG